VSPAGAGCSLLRHDRSGVPDGAVRLVVGASIFARPVGIRGQIGRLPPLGRIATPSGRRPAELI
jgi:hypothetical protein